MPTTLPAPRFAVEPELSATESHHRVAVVPRGWATSALDGTVTAVAPSAAEQRRGELRVVLDVETDRGTAEFEMPLRVTRLDDEGSSWKLHGTAYRLTLDIEVGATRGEIRWLLEPGGRDAAGRARVLDLLIALSGSGVAVFRDPDFGDLAMLHLRSQALDESLRDERAFLTDVLVIEAWSGVRLPLPDEPDDASLQDVAEFADVVRRRRVDVRFTSDIECTVAYQAKGGDELRLRRVEPLPLFGIEVPLGIWHYRVSVEFIESYPNDDGTWTATFKPTSDVIHARIGPLARGAAKAAKAADSGWIPRPSDGRRTAARRRAHDAARDVTRDWHVDGPGYDDVRDSLRRRWPT